MLLPDLPKWVPVAVDTETNGVWADSGARVSVVSLAWMDPDILRSDDLGPLRAAIRTGEGVTSLALPFSQGIWIGQDGSIKPGSTVDLFTDAADNPNLGNEAWSELMWWLTPRRHVYHNSKFDLEKLRYAPIGWDGCGRDFINSLYWDTQVSAPMIWPTETSSLKPTGERLWGEDAAKEAEALKPYLGPKTNPRYDLVPWEVIGPYAAKDTELTIRLFYQQLGMIGLLSPGFDAVNEVLLRRCRREVAVARNLYRMERAGIPYDAKTSLAAADLLSRRMVELDATLPFKPTGPAGARYFFSAGQEMGADGRLHDRADIEPYSVTDTGKPQFTEEVVTKLVADLPPDTEAGKAARTWAERNKLATAIKMWYRPYAEGLGTDGRLRTCFRQVTRGRGTEDGGTRSGRFSVERVNLQAIPHDYRLIAGQNRDWKVPTPRQLIGLAAGRFTDWELWEFDLAQAELRVAAAWSNCERMLDALRHGRDLHAETAEELFNVRKGDSDYGYYRQIGKRANFTLCFGAGGPTLARFVSKETGVQMTPGEGTRIVERWNGIYPEYRRAIERWSTYAEQHHAVPLASVDGFATGRNRIFAPDELRIGTHKAFNQLVQGSLGEFAKDWNLTTEGICDEASLGYVSGLGWTGLLLVIHDSQVILLPSGDRGEAIASQILDRTRALWQRFFNTADPQGRISTVDGFAEGKRW